MARQLLIDVNSETWRSVVESIDQQLRSSRHRREVPGLDVRTLDYELGRIHMLEKILELPEVQAEKPAEPIRGSGVYIPGHSPTWVEDI